MGKKCWIVSLLLTILLVAGDGLILPAQAASQRPKVKIGYFSFSSFQDMDSDGGYSGYGYDYLQEIAKYAGWDYEYVYASWDECLSMLENGKIDILGSAQYTEERASVFDFSELESGVSYAVLCASSENNSLAYEDFEAFDGMTVGILAGNSRNDRLEEYCVDNGFSVKTVVYDDQEKLLKALHSGQVDTILTSNLRKDKQERIVARFSPSPFYFVTTKGNKAVLDKLNYAQTQIKLTNPHFDAELYEKYYSVDVVEKPVFTMAERAFIQSAPVLKVIYNPDWAPLCTKNEETGEFQGIVADLFQEITANSGLSFTFVPQRSEGESFSMLNTGEADLLSCCQQDYNAAANNSVVLTNPYLTAPNVMLTNTLHSGKKGYTVALTNDYLRSFEDEARNKGYEIHYYSTILDCFEALRKGEVSAAYSNTYTANLTRSQYEYAHLGAITLADLQDILCVAIPQTADTRLLTILNKSIEYISNDTLEEIIMANTVVQHSLTLRDIVYQKPVLSLVVCAVVFIAIIVLLVYILFIKNRSNKKIYDLLYRDSLTGIWNFNKFRIESERLIQNSQRYALVNTDIEHFKFFNDSNGYATGDVVLKTIARVLEEFSEPGEGYARLSADNFIALLKYTNQENLVQRLKEFDEKINSIPKIENECYHVSLASGIYVVQKEDKDISFAIDCANEARKAIKGSHKSGYMFYDEHLRDALIAEREIGEVMEQALAEGQFLAYYQPKYDIKTTGIVGAEALVRWKHPQRGLIPPGVFIPVFEKNGFVIEVDFYVFECVCRDMRARLDAGKKVRPVSSNFSRLHFHRSDFVERLRKTTDRYHIPNHLLELEITESTAQENVDSLVSLLRELRHLGFSIAMDDFGTGYSSLNLLNKLPVDTLKLDKDFLQKGIKDEKESIVIEGFVSIADKLNMQVVCEGVETEDQASFLRDIGCNIAQGYLYSKPVPREEYERLLNEEPDE